MFISKQGKAAPAEVDTMHSNAPQDIWRSEAFAEDLAPETSPPLASTWRVRRLGSLWLCLLPVVVASLGGAVAMLDALG